MTELLCKVALAVRRVIGDSAPLQVVLLLHSTSTILIKSLCFTVDKGHDRNMKEVTSSDNSSCIFASYWLSTAGTKDSKKVLNFSISSWNYSYFATSVRWHHVHRFRKSWNHKKRHYIEDVKADEQAQIWRTTVNKRNDNIIESNISVLKWGCIYFYLKGQFLPSLSVYFQKCKIKV